MKFGKPTQLEDFVGPSRTSGVQVCFQYCPVCGSSKWKLYANPETGMWFCHGHGAGGQVDVGVPQEGAAQLLLERLSHTVAPSTPDWPEISLPDWEPLCPKALKYLASRGISPTLAVRLGIVEVVGSLRTLIPYYGPAGRIIYWSARAYSPLEEGPKYLGASGRHPLYVLPRWRPHETLVVVEGVFDAITVWRNTGMATVALGGKSLPRYLEPSLLVLGTRNLRVVLDGDALGGALKLKARLGTKRHVEVVPLPLGEDPASLGVSIKEVLGC